MKTLLTQIEAAEYLGISESTLMRYRRAGILPAVRYSATGKIQFKRQSLDALIDKKEQAKQRVDGETFKPSKPKPPVSMAEHERAKAELAKKLGFSNERTTP